MHIGAVSSLVQGDNNVEGKSWKGRASIRAPGRAGIVLLAVGFFVSGGVMAEPTVEEQIATLEEQIELLTKQVNLSVAQQAQDANTAKGVAEALKAQVTAEAELTKAEQSASFAKWAGIKAGLESIGSPPGKEGTITIATGQAGTQLLKLQKPLIQAVNEAAKVIAETIKDKGPVVYAPDADVIAALRSATVEQSFKDASEALLKTLDDLRSAPAAGGARIAAAPLVVAAAAGLVLKTAVDFAKFFRTDQSLALFDNSAEAQYLLERLLEKHLLANGKAGLVLLNDINAGALIKKAGEQQDVLLELHKRHAEAVNRLAEIEELTDDQKKPLLTKIDALKANAALVKEIIDAYHPAKNTDAFWTYVVGLHKLDQIRDEKKNYLPRLSLRARAQTIQVTRTRAYWSDSVRGSTVCQIDYRLTSGTGSLIDSGFLMITLDKSDPDAEVSIQPDVIR